MAWPKDGVVRVVLDYLLACCDGDGAKPVKDIELKLEGMVSAKDDGEFSRFFKTAYLFDFAQEYKIKHLEDKLKREMEFMAKVDNTIQLTTAFLLTCCRANTLSKSRRSTTWRITFGNRTATTLLSSS